MKNSLKCAGFVAMLSIASGAMAQSYRAVVLADSNSWAYGGYNNASGGSSYVPGTTISHATLWDLAGNSTDVHPSFLDTATTKGISQINGMWNFTWVGYGRGVSTNNRLAAMVWQFGTPSLIPTPNGGDNYSSQAHGTDGQSVVGEYTPWGSTRDRVSPGDQHAFVYDIATGSFTDLYNGNPCIATDVKFGQQVGYEYRGQAEARLWSGNAKNFVNLHPNGFDASLANALDGGRQVGLVSQVVNRIGEAKRGIKIRYDQACMWTGTAASMQFLISAYPNSVATGISGTQICGNGIVTSATGTRSAYHALVWTGPLEVATELHSLLPAGYVQSFANAIDGNGNVSGSATDSLGKAHAVVWIRQ